MAEPVHVRARRALDRRRRRFGRFTRRTLARPHRTLVVPLLTGPESEHALALACRIAADRRSRILVLAPLFVEAELPLDAHFHEEEEALRTELARARALVESYGVVARGRIVRVREGQLGRAVAEEADATRASLVVLGAETESKRGFRRPFSRDVWSILNDSPCRVMVATGIGNRARTARSAA
jgi:K+-sensing histidine kinase KdpD